MRLTLERRDRSPAFRYNYCTLSLHTGCPPGPIFLVRILLLRATYCEWSVHRPPSRTPPIEVIKILPSCLEHHSEDMCEAHIELAKIFMHTTIKHYLHQWPLSLLHRQFPSPLPIGPAMEGTSTDDLRNGLSRARLLDNLDQGGHRRSC